MQANELAARYRFARPRSIDGVQHQPIQRSQETTGGQPTHGLPARIALSRPFQIAPKKTRPSKWDRLQLPILITGGILTGFLVQALWFGVAAIVLYSIIVLMLRIPSRVTFMLAFMSLITVSVLLVLKPNVALAGNFATYTFLLLVTGVIALAIEARPQKRRRRPKNR